MNSTSHRFLSAIVLSVLLAVSLLASEAQPALADTDPCTEAGLILFIGHANSSGSVAFSPGSH